MPVFLRNFQMTPQEIAAKAEMLRIEQQEVAAEGITYGNYKRVLGKYQQIVNDAIVLIRELAEQQIVNLPKAGSFHD